MKGNRNTFILVGIIVFLIGIYFLITNAKNYKWYETYEEKDENPYGCFALVELLKDKNKEFEVLKVPISKGNLKKGNYLFVGNHLEIDSLESRKLLQFVKKGNKAFIFSNNQPYNIFKALGQYDCLGKEDEENEESLSQDSFEDTLVNSYNYKDVITDSLVSMRLGYDQKKKNQKFTFDYVYNNKLNTYSWFYLNDKELCDLSNIKALGTLNDTLVNFYKITYGKGEFYFHTNPIVFTNYHVIKEDRIEYLDRIFPSLRSGPIYWDEYNKSTHFNTPTPRTESPLKFILSDDSLKYGWYLSIALILLYIVFYSKREQRIIPVLEENMNTSIEYTETIGRLYFLQNNHKKLCIQKMKYFLGYVRQKYHISTKSLDTNFIKNLSIKSGLPQNSVEIIFKQYKRIYSFESVAEDSLINFHHALEYFYKNCK